MKRYTEEQIIRLLKEAEATSISETSRKHGVSEWSLYRWRKMYGDMDIPDAKRLKVLEKENARLKRIVAQQAVDIDALKEVLSKKW
ncbi:MAG: transposase [Candidatus Abyssobacteria bacterium SURF_5]|uniref:Transposase n=1 Tax=Abyssobacteria bacterium (strain SURF_5) TaxID=2093360 RepID=A0A3A4NYW8_ABYX5|nr:MAG: transposase [Candidatus Abyssubacteria bacterium SURF_5]